MGVTKAIVTALKADTDFVNAIGTESDGSTVKVYSMESPQSVKLPYAVVMLGQKQTHPDKSNASNLDQTFLSVSITEKDVDSLEDLAEKVRLRLDRLSGTFDGVVIEDILYDGNGGGMVNIGSNTQNRMYEMEEEFEVFVKR